MHLQQVLIVFLEKNELLFAVYNIPLDIAVESFVIQITLSQKKILRETSVTSGILQANIVGRAQHVLRDGSHIMAYSEVRGARIPLDDNAADTLDYNQNFWTRPCATRRDEMALYSRNDFFPVKIYAQEYILLFILLTTQFLDQHTLSFEFACLILSLLRKILSAKCCLAARYKIGQALLCIKAPH